MNFKLHLNWTTTGARSEWPITQSDVRSDTTSGGGCRLKRLPRELAVCSLSSHPRPINQVLHRYWHVVILLNCSVHFCSESVLPPARKLLSCPLSVYMLLAAITQHRLGTRVLESHTSQLFLPSIRSPLYSLIQVSPTLKPVCLILPKFCVPVH